MMRLLRLCTGPTLTVVTAAALAGGPARHAAAASALPSGPADPHRPTCTTTDSDAFPLRTRIHGGPSSYDAGGGFGTWSLDLTNTTDRTCGNVHPVIVLVDDKRELQAGQPQLEFFTGTQPHPVRFERTDADELVGVLDHEGFAGFTVRPGRTVTVRLRLAVTSAAVPNDVVANAAVVQRRGDDGEWVGESNEYRFRIVGSDGGGGEEEEDGGGGLKEKEKEREKTKGKEKEKEKEEGGGSRKRDEAGARKDGGGGDSSARQERERQAGEGEGDESGTRTEAEGSDGGDGSAGGSGETGDGSGETDGGGDSGRQESDATGTGVPEENLTLAEELARTGLSVPPYAVGALLIGAGALLVTLTRRRKSR